jgi:hypothetical protein
MSQSYNLIGWNCVEEFYVIMFYVYYVGLNGFWIQQVATMLKTFGKIGNWYSGITIWLRSLSYLTSLPFTIGLKQRRKERITCL